MPMLLNLGNPKLSKVRLEMSGFHQRMSQLD
jgi:hypothetical protein